MKIKGINLGGWFVLEKWIKPSLFEGIEGKDETKFVTLKTEAYKELKNHWETWITKDDFLWIKNTGFNLIRIPIPFWIFGDIKPYYGSIEYLDEAMKWALELNLNVMLDLHTAPGCQNGFDNGGIEGVMEWHKDQKNIDLTVNILGKIASRYKDNKALHSIQILNEPFLTIDIDIVKKFYKKAYDEIRKYVDNSVYIVFHDSFRLNEWNNYFKENNMYNYILDTHQYQCFDKKHNEFKPEEHISFSMGAKRDYLNKIQLNIPTLVGEWSLGIRKNEYFNISEDNYNLFLKMYFEAQMYAFNNLEGYIFWTYKTEDKNKGWNFRYLVESNIIDINLI